MANPTVSYEVTREITTYDGRRLLEESISSFPFHLEKEGISARKAWLNAITICIPNTAIRSISVTIHRM